MLVSAICFVTSQPNTGESAQCDPSIPLSTDLSFLGDISELIAGQLALGYWGQLEAEMKGLFSRNFHLYQQSLLLNVAKNAKALAGFKIDDDESRKELKKERPFTKGSFKQKKRF